MDSRGNYSNYNTGGMRDRGDRYQRGERGERGERSRGPRRNPSSPPQQPKYRRDEPRGDNYRNDNYRNDNYRNGNYRGDNNRDDNYRSNRGNGPQIHIKDNSYKQFNNSSNSLNHNNSNTNVNLIQSPFQNPYKIDSNTNKGIINDPSKDRLEAYSKLKNISPMKFYISIIITIIITTVLIIIGVIAVMNKGLAASNIKDVTTGVAQGYFFYGGFMIIAIFTGVYAFIRKWNNLLVTYCSFLFVSCLYLGYFIIDLANVKINSLDVMNTRWKDDFHTIDKANIENQFNCCGYYNPSDDPVESDECNAEETYTKRSLFGGYEEPMYYNVSRLNKRMVAEEGGCALEIERVISSKLTMYIILLAVLLVLNVAAVICTILDIKQYADILHELSNPFA